MKEIYVVLGFFLLIGLLIFRIIEEQRHGVRRSKLQAARASDLSQEEDRRQT
jgi:hypothetical protein